LRNSLSPPLSHKPLSPFLFCFVWAVLGFELRASCLLGRSHVSLAHHAPNPFCFIVISQTVSPFLCPGLALYCYPPMYAPPIWDYRQGPPCLPHLLRWVLTNFLKFVQAVLKRWSSWSLPNWVAGIAGVSHHTHLTISMEIFPTSYLEETFLRYWDY
jgi:hypothetical protein